MHVKRNFETSNMHYGSTRKGGGGFLKIDKLFSVQRY